MYQVKGEPVLTLASATDANKPYYNAFLKRTRRTLAKGNEVTAETMAHNRNDDRALYPEFVLKGWKNVIDDEGKEVPFSKESAAEFIQMLPDWLFDDMRNHAISPANFLTIDPQELSGN